MGGRGGGGLLTYCKESVHQTPPDGRRVVVLHLRREVCGGTVPPQRDAEFGGDLGVSLGDGPCNEDNDIGIGIISVKDQIRQDHSNTSRYDKGEKGTR